MRRPLIAGNWKLNKTIGAAKTLAEALKQSITQVDDCDVLVAPVYTALWPVAEVLAGSSIKLCGQEMFYETSGAFTGAISGPFLKDAGCTYTLIGHSERRALFGETLPTTQLRVASALHSGITPILCVGETLEAYEAKQTEKVVTAQLEAGLQAFGEDHDISQLVVAYEPVWAIGTGKVASPEVAQGVHHALRAWIAHHDEAAADNVRIVYGGSVKADNAESLLCQPDIDGALVGGASLKADAFAAIVAARYG